MVPLLPRSWGLRCLPASFQSPGFRARVSLEWSLLLDSYYAPVLEPKSPSPNKVLTANTLLTFLEDLGTPRERVGEMLGQPGHWLRFRNTNLSWFKQRKGIYKFTCQLQAWLDPGVQTLIQIVFPFLVLLSSGMHHSQSGFPLSVPG